MVLIIAARGPPHALSTTTIPRIRATTRARFPHPRRGVNWLSRRFVEINVWRPIRGPVRRDPLGRIDGRSIAPGDLVTTKLVYPDRMGEIYYGADNPAHRWYYFPDMEAHEAILVKCYDSATDGRTRFSLHAAFADPEVPADAPPRKASRSARSPSSTDSPKQDCG